MAGRSRAVLITLTIKRRRKLEQIIAAGTSPQRLVLRAKIVLAAAAGTANEAIARQLGCSAAVVRTWRGRFAVPGYQACSTGPAAGGRKCTGLARGWRSSPWPPPSRLRVRRSGRAR